MNSGAAGRDYEPIGDEAGGGISVRAILIFVLIAFIGGALATGWLVTRYDLFGGAATSLMAEEESPAETTATAKAPARTGDEVMPMEGEEVAPPPVPLELERALAARVADLEFRLSQINVQAQAASGNAARAEGLLLAFAARRALDKGSQLGYIENQLRLRFGNAQPRAVNTVIAAARRPVTLEELQSGLADLGETLTVGQGDGDILGAIGRELEELFVLRKEGSPSPAPSQRLDRARRFIEAGNVEAAIAEVERLPGATKAEQWLRQARRYKNARDALDLIENAAILEPRQLRTGEGNPVIQPSPLAPQ